MLTKLQKMRSKKGFTLMELLIVIAIIVILVAIIIPVMNGQTQKAKNAADAANARNATALVAMYYLDADATAKITDCDSLATAKALPDVGAQITAIEWYNGDPTVVDGVFTAANDAPAASTAG